MHSAAAGLTHLAAPGATLLMVAFKAGRGIVLPRGMDKQDVVALPRDGWDLEESRSVATDDTPASFAAPTRPRTASLGAPRPPNLSYTGRSQLHEEPAEVLPLMRPLACGLRSHSAPPIAWMNDGDRCR